MDRVTDGSRGGIQEFIFSRELAEVYLLLDHISGRSQKQLSDAFRSGNDQVADAAKMEQDWLKKICLIGWPPESVPPTTPTDRADQAATLFVAKDRLNAAASPANGASIVFTLMVAGDDDVKPLRDRNRGLRDWWFSGPSHAPPAEPRDGKPGATDGSANPALRGPLDGGVPDPPGGILGGNPNPPSRISLAQFAYPGLIKSAARFKTYFSLLLFLLFAFLIFTCILSWDVAAGRALLARLDAIEVTRVAIEKRVADAEAATSKTGTLPKGVWRYCPEASETSGRDKKAAPFKDATQRQICDERNDNIVARANARNDIADWTLPWRWLRGFSNSQCNGKNCVADATPDTLYQPQWAAVIVDVLASAVLPLCYGFLGAGAAVVRGIWAKMRDSLLSPRDLSLSAGQLALGAVIGACISLFFTPAGGASSGSGLISSVSLTPSALSFIAGLGVDSVFVALESLIRRVFNVSDSKSAVAAPVSKS